ncbi:hypothetical protein ACQ4PT_004786 [Festuca glaucescens]
MEEWVLLGESGSDADSVQFVDGSDDGSASDKGSEMIFTTVQNGGNPSVDDVVSCGDGEELQKLSIGGENEDEEEENAHGYFDLNLPALAGSKAVFGASGDCFDPNLAASILSMGNVGSDTGMIHCAETEDTDGIEHPERRACAHCASMDTDQGSDAAEVIIYDDIDTESSDADEDQPESCSHGRHLDDIDMESLCAVDDEDIDIDMARVRTAARYLACAPLHVSQFVTRSIASNPDDEDDTESFDDGEDTESSDAEESNGSDDGTESSDAEESDYSDDGTGSSDESESDYSDSGTESSDTEESYYSDEGTEFFDVTCTTGGAGPKRRLAAGASTAVSRPPTAPHLFFPNGIGASTAPSRSPNAPVFFPNRAGGSTAASRPPSAPHLYFRSRAEASTAPSRDLSFDFFANIDGCVEAVCP